MIVSAVAYACAGSGARHSHQEERAHRRGRRAEIGRGAEVAFWVKEENCAFASGSLQTVVNCYWDTG